MYLLTIYESFVRPNIDYADMIYHKPLWYFFIEKIKWMQCNACLLNTNAFQGTSRELLYQELGFYRLAQR